MLCDLKISHGQFGCLGEEVYLYPPLLFSFIESEQRSQNRHHRLMVNHFRKSLLFSFSFFNLFSEIVLPFRLAIYFACRCMSETPASFHNIMAQMVLVMTDDAFKDCN